MFNIRNQEQAIREAQARATQERQSIEHSTQSAITACQKALLRSALKTGVRKGASRLLRGRKASEDQPKKRRIPKRLLGTIGIACSAWLILSTRNDSKQSH